MSTEVGVPPAAPEVASVPADGCGPPLPSSETMPHECPSETSVPRDPVQDVLSGLGIGPLPGPSGPGGDVVGLPGVPGPVGLDPSMLIKPILDLLACFGTGRLGGPGSADQAHRQIAGVLERGVSTLTGAAKAIDGGWTGTAAGSAVTAATRTAAESGALAAQGSGMAFDLQAAAGIVATGAMELQGVVAETAGLLAAAAPTLLTPPGQAAALGIAANGLAQGLAVVAATRAQLAGPTSDMVRNGAPVPITPVPGAGGEGGARAAADLMTGMLPLVQAGARFAVSLLAGAGTDGSASDAPAPDTSASGLTPAGTRPAGVGGAGCPPTCAAGTPATTVPKPPGATVTGSAGPAGGGGPVGGGPAVPEVNTPEAPLAQCPVTTNAVAAVTSSTPEAHTATEAAGPAGPMTATPAVAPSVAARPSDGPSGPALAASFTTGAGATPPETPSGPPESPSVSPEWLSAASAEALEFDAALVLGIGQRDLAGSV